MNNRNPFAPGMQRNAAEERLHEHARAGRICTFATDVPDAERTISAAYLCYLIMGGESNEVHQRGIRLTGAVIEGNVELQECETKLSLYCNNCDFSGFVNLTGFSGRTVDLTSSNIFGLDEDGDSLICDRMKLAGSLFLRSDPEDRQNNFTTQGAIRLPLSAIAGSLHLQGASVCATGLREGAASALNVRGARIEGSILFSRETQVFGQIDLTASHCKGLSIGKGFLPGHVGDLRLDGFVYERVEGTAKLFEFENARGLLSSQPAEHIKKTFRPQPFTHLAAVLRSMGQADTAREISILRERLKTRSMLNRMAFLCRRIPRGPTDIFKFLGLFLRVLFRSLFGLLVAYGYKPHRAFILGLVFIIGGAEVFRYAYSNQEIVPNNAFLLKLEWNAALDGRVANFGPDGAVTFLPDEGGCIVPYDCFLASVPDYPRFRPLVYSIDAFVPVFVLRQEDAWIVRSDRDTHGLLNAEAYLWLHVMVGWAVALLLAASLTGLLRAGDRL